MESWEQIWDFPKYSISDEGRVRNDITGRLIVLTVNREDVTMVGLMGDDGIQHKRSVALLVAQAFIPQPSRVFDTPVCKNGDRSNVAARNLEWRPRWFAIQYNRQFIRRWPHPINKPIRDIRSEIVYPNSFETAKWFALLEKDLVLAILNHTFVWPTYQMFEVVSD